MKQNPLNMMPNNEEDFNPDEMIPDTPVSVENEAINRIM